MKRIVKLLLVSVFIALCGSCEKDDPVPSRTTFFPEVNQYIVKRVGESFDFSEIKAFENGKEIEITLGEDVTIDTNAVGVYGVPFTTENSDGFGKSGQVFISVVEDPELVKSIDISGNYFDEFAPDENIEVTSLGNGFFRFSDIFVPDGIVAVVAIQNEGTLVLPEQNSIYGSIIADESRDEATYGFFDDKAIGLGVRFEGDEFPFDLFFNKK